METPTLNKLCEKIKKDSYPGTYYFGDYNHQVHLLNQKFDQHQGFLAAQSGTTQTMQHMAVSSANAMRTDGIQALQRRMEKFFNLRSKYKSNGELRT